LQNSPTRPANDPERNGGHFLEDFPHLRQQLAMHDEELEVGVG